MSLKSFAEMDGEPDRYNPYSESRPRGGGLSTGESSSLIKKHSDPTQKLSQAEAEIARRSYLNRVRKQEAEDRSRYTSSNAGFGKVGEVDTDENPPEDNDQDYPDGFQVVTPADYGEVEKRQAREEALTAANGEATNPQTILDENDHFQGVSDHLEADIKSETPDLEEQAHEFAGDMLTNVDINNDRRDYDTTLKISRISDHRLKGYISHNGSESLVKNIWDNAILVEVLVSPSGETKISIIASGKNRKGESNEIRIDTGDFFKMFSIPSVSDGESRFQTQSLHLNNEKDHKKMVDFFERVSVGGKLIGDENKVPPTIRFVAWNPREKIRKATSFEKELSRTNNGRAMPWHENDLTGDAFNSPGWPEEIKEEKKKKKWWW